MPSFAHFLFAQDLHLQTQGGELLDAARELFGIEYVRRFGDEVPGEHDRVGQPVETLERLFRRLGIIHDHQHALGLDGFFSGFSVVRYLSKR